MSAFMDTDIASRLYNLTANAELREALSRQRLILPFVVPAEMIRGGLKARWGEVRMCHLRTWLSGWPVMFSDNEIVESWGAIVATSDRSGKNIKHNDAWIAACCRSSELALFTLNRKHFDWIEDLELLP